VRTSLKNKMFQRLKTASGVCHQIQKRNIYLCPPMLCKEDTGKPPVVPPPRRTKLSPEARIRSMLENVSDADEETPEKNNSENDVPNKPVINSENDVFGKKPKLPWKFGRRRSLSPMSRVEGMLEDQDKSDKTDK